MLVSARLDGGRIVKSSKVSLGGDVVQRDLVGPAGGRVPSVGGDRGGENGMQALGKWLPLNGGGRADGALGSLIDPQLQQAQFLGRQPLRPHIVIIRRHERFALSRREQHEQASAPFPGTAAGPSAPPLRDLFRRLQDEIAFGVRAVMARQAIPPKDRQDLLGEIHFVLAL